MFCFAKFAKFKKIITKQDIYHLLVLWKKFGLTPDQIYEELEKREGKTGLRK